MPLAPPSLCVGFNKFPVFGEEGSREGVFEVKAFFDGLGYFLREEEAVGNGLGDAGIAEVGHGPLVSEQRLCVFGDF